MTAQWDNYYIVGVIQSKLDSMICESPTTSSKLRFLRSAKILVMVGNG